MVSSFTVFPGGLYRDRGEEGGDGAQAPVESDAVEPNGSAILLMHLAKKWAETPRRKSTRAAAVATAAGLGATASMTASAKKRNLSVGSEKAVKISELDGKQSKSMYKTLPEIPDAC